MKTFEKYLAEDVFPWIAKGVLDDDMPDAFDDWMGSLDTEDYIKCAELYGMECYLAGKKDVLSKLTNE